MSFEKIILINFFKKIERRKNNVNSDNYGQWIVVHKDIFVKNSFEDNTKISE